MLGGAETSTPCVDHERAAGVYLGGGLRGANFTSRMPVIFSFDLSCAQPSAGRTIAPAATAAPPFRKSRLFMPLPLIVVLGKPSVCPSLTLRAFGAQNGPHGCFFCPSANRSSLGGHQSDD